MEGVTGSIPVAPTTKSLSTLDKWRMEKAPANRGVFLRGPPDVVVSTHEKTRNLRARPCGLFELYDHVMRPPAVAALEGVELTVAGIGDARASCTVPPHSHDRRPVRGAESGPGSFKR